MNVPLSRHQPSAKVSGSVQGKLFIINNIVSATVWMSECLLSEKVAILGLKNQRYLEPVVEVADVLSLMGSAGGAGRSLYPSRVRMWYFCRSLPTSFTLIERQPRLGLGCG